MINGSIDMLRAKALRELRSIQFSNYLMINDELCALNQVYSEVLFSCSNQYLDSLLFYLFICFIVDSKLKYCHFDRTGHRNHIIHTYIFTFTIFTLPCSFVFIRDAPKLFGPKTAKKKSFRCSAE